MSDLLVSAADLNVHVRYGRSACLPHEMWGRDDPGKSATHMLAVRRGKIATPKVSPKKEQKND